MVAVGSASYTYQVAEGWGKLPHGWSFIEATAVAADSKDNVYVFNRGEHPMIVFDREGNFLRSWGEDIFSRAHGIFIAPDDTIFCADEGDHTVKKCTLDGKVLLTVGKPEPYMSGDPFNRCTHVAMDPANGDFYVCDGYGNARVHKYSPDGKLLFSWGESGTGPGQFNIPHNIATDKDGWVYLADRENHRIQVFDKNGKFETQLVDMARPCGLYIDQSAELVYVGELGADILPSKAAFGLGPRVSIMDLKGNVLARLGDGPESEELGRFVAPHGICIDSRGDIYVSEVSWTHAGSKLNPPRELRSLHKLVHQS